MKEVSITGLGAITSTSSNIKCFEHALREGITGIRSLPKDYLKEVEPFTMKAAAILENFDFCNELDKLEGLPAQIKDRALRCARRSTLVSQTAVIVVAEALINAELISVLHANDRRKVSIVLAGQNLNQKYIYDIHQRYSNNLYSLPPSYGLNFFDTNTMSILSEVFQISGEGLSIGGASASGNIGIVQGYRMVQAGISEITLVVGALTDLSLLELQAFVSMGAMAESEKDPSTICRPFDIDHSGFVYGQGAGCLVLESKESMQERNFNSITQVIGVSSCLDANHLSNPSVEGEVRAMTEAMSAAEITIDDVNYINAHGSSSPIGDKTEARAIKHVFSNKIDPLPINSTKSITGHCVCAAGVLETIATIIQMEKEFLHPNLNLNQPIDTELNFIGPESIIQKTRFAISNSFGFGGINSSIVLGRSKNT